MRALPFAFFVALPSLVSLSSGAQPAETADPGGKATTDAPAAAIEREALPLEYPPPAAKTNLALTGGAIFVGWYGAAIGASFLEPDAPGSTDLRIPVVGPWMAVAQAGCAKGNPDCSTAWVVVRAILQAMDGIGQAGGLAVIGEALFLPTRAHVRGGDFRNGFRHAAAPTLKLHAGERTAPLVTSLRPIPFVGAGDAVGLGLQGTF